MKVAFAVPVLPSVTVALLTEISGPLPKVPSPLPSRMVSTPEWTASQVEPAVAVEVADLRGGRVSPARVGDVVAGRLQRAVAVAQVHLDQTLLEPGRGHGHVEVAVAVEVGQHRRIEILHNVMRAVVRE